MIVLDDELLRAVESDDIVKVKRFLTRDGKVNALSAAGLPLAMYVKSVECLKLLVDFGCDMRMSTRAGCTVLHYAGFKTSALTTEWIRVFGHPDIPDSFGETPLFSAVRFRQHGFALQLLRSGAAPNVLNSDGESVLHVSALVGDRQMMRLLLDHGAVVDLPNAQGETALMIAAFHDKWFPETLVDLLLAHGASRSLISSNGGTALVNARAGGSFRAVELLTSSSNR